MQKKFTYFTYANFKSNHFAAVTFFLNYDVTTYRSTFTFIIFKLISSVNFNVLLFYLAKKTDIN